MDFGSVYSQLEEKWYGILDALSEKGIPIYGVIDPIENAGIPSLPLFAGIVIILLALAAYSMASGGIAPGEFTVKVADINGNAIKGATVDIIVDAESIAQETTNSKGEAFFSLAANTRYQAEVTTELCGKALELIDTAEMQFLEINMTCTTPELAGCSGLSGDKLVTQLTDDQNNIPSACALRVYNAAGDAVDNPFALSTAGELDISRGGSCPSEDDRLLIDCQYHQWNGTVAGMYRELELFGQLTLAVKDGAPGPGTLLPVEVTRQIYVKVQNTAGTPLEGIGVTAADSEGNALVVYFEGTALEAATDATGTARLVLPDEQSFNIRLEDPKGAYQPYTSATSYTATLAQSQTPLVLNMASGYETKIYVKEEARQTAIASATVMVSSEDRVIATGTTGTDGIFTVTLLNGAKYLVNINHPMYFAASAEIAGAQDQSVFMTPIDETKTGTLVVDVFNARGLQEEYPNVRIELRSQSNDTLWMSCISPANGRCLFSKVKAGSYYLKATPPGAISPQAFPVFDVAAQNTSVQTLRVVPNQLTLTVLTQVSIDGTAVRKMGVEVALWNADYQEAVEKKKSDATRKTEFTLDQGTRYFLVAEYVDAASGTKYGPLKTSASVMSQSKKTTLLLTQVTEEAGVDAPAEIAKGSEAKVTLRLALPDYRPNQPYESAYVEMFVGDPGGVNDIKRTPIVIQPITLSDIASQEPFVSAIEKADEYNYDATPKLNDDGTSKYLKVKIGKYANPTVYTVEVPVYARELAASGDTKISYRAAWKAPDGQEVTSNQGLWSEKAIKVVGESAAANELETGDFYSYSAYFTKQAAGDATPSPSVSEGSLFYLHVDAKARQALQKWSVDVNNLPDKAEAVSYSGTITRASGTIVNVAESPLSGSDFKIQNSEAAYSLEKDDTLSLTVALRAKERGKGTLTLFGDYDNSLGYEVARKARTGATPIAGVTATLVASSNFCIVGYENGLTQRDACYFDYPANTTLPANSKKLRLTLELEGNATADVAIEAADASIKFDSTGANYYEGTLSAPGTITIDGYGSSQAANTMSVFVWEHGATRPNAPWQTITYGPIDYSLKVTPFANGVVEATISESTSELQAKIMRREGTQEKAVGADILTDNKADVSTGSGRGAATLVLDAEPYFRYSVDALHPLKARDGATVTANSPLFGKLKYTSTVAGLIFEPAYPKLLFTRPLPLGGSMSETVTIRSSWKEAVSITLNILQRDGYNLLTTVKTYSSGNVLLQTLSGADAAKPITIPAEGRAEVIIAATANAAACRLDLAPTILQIESEKLAAPAHYTLGLQCTVEGAGELEAPEVANYVSRETLAPSAITMDSCSVATDGGYAFVCDSEQLGIAVAKASESLLASPVAIEDVRYYAFGKDTFSAATMSEALKENRKAVAGIANVYDKASAALQAATSDVVVNGKPSCGIVRVNLTKMNLDQDVNVTFSTSTEGATWCQKNHPHYTIGLMNFDKALRPDLGSYMSFAGDAQKLLDAIAKAKEQGSQLDASIVFGYDAGNLKDRAGSEAATMFTYRECERKASGDCPGFAVKRLSDDYPVIFYYHVTEQDDILVGMVYDENLVVGAGGAYTQLPAYRAIFAKRLADYLTKGSRSGWLAGTANFQMAYSPMYDPLADQIIDLTGPEIVEDSFKLYGFTPLGARSEELVGNRSINVELKATGEPVFCVISNLDGAGKALDEVTSDQLTPIDEDTLGLSLPWTLPSGSGSKLVSAFCVDANGIPSHKVRARITLDDTVMSLMRPLPRMVTTHTPVTTIPQFANSKITIRDRFSDVKYCEFRLAGTEIPNVEICDDNNDGVFTSADSFDNNANGDASKKIPGTTIESWKDGCCEVTKLADDSYYKNAEVSCWSPYIEAVDTATNVELWCRDASGNEANLGKVGIWRYSAEAPQFEVPEDFIMGTSGSEDPLERTFFFDLENMPIGGTGKTEWGKFSLAPTTAADVFNYEFDVYDIDGLDPASGCKWSVAAHTDNYRGTVLSANSFASSGGCTGEATNPGSMRDLHVTCPVKLQKDAVNNVSIECTDLSDQTDIAKKRATASFLWTWDETGPVLSDVTPGQFGAYKFDPVTRTNKRDMAPTVTFTATDDYSPVAGCVASIGTVDGGSMSFACELQATGEKLATTQKVVCDYQNLTEENLPIGLLNMSAGSLKISCIDLVDNEGNKTKDGKDSWNMQGMDLSTDLPALAKKACEMLRYGATAEEIAAEGFITPSGEDIKGIKDFPSTYDDKGLMTMVYATKGSATRSAVLGELGTLESEDISRLNPDCASSGLCMGAIQAAILAASGACGAATGPGAVVCYITASKEVGAAGKEAKETGRVAVKVGQEAERLAKLTTDVQDAAKTANALATKADDAVKAADAARATATQASMDLAKMTKPTNAQVEAAKASAELLSKNADEMAKAAEAARVAADAAEATLKTAVAAKTSFQEAITLVKTQNAFLNVITKGGATKWYGTFGNALLKTALPSRLWSLSSRAMALQALRGALYFARGGGEALGYGYRVNNDPQVCTYSDEGDWAGKGLTEIGMLGLSFVCPLCEVVRVGIPDPFQSHLCMDDTPTASVDNPVYVTLSARVTRVDMAGGGNPLLDGLSVCFNSCNDYVCTVDVSSCQGSDCETTVIGG